jgi:hypothetical protein
MSARAVPVAARAGGDPSGTGPQPGRIGHLGFRSVPGPGAGLCDEAGEQGTGLLGQ